MAALNPKAREIAIKVVYYGPGLGGKTSTLEALHRTTVPERRGKLLSLATPVDRTLFFDFLPLRPEIHRAPGAPPESVPSVRLQLFTVPGQVYFNATRKLVTGGKIVCAITSSGEWPSCLVNASNTARSITTTASACAQNARTCSTWSPNSR